MPPSATPTPTSPVPAKPAPEAVRVEPPKPGPAKDVRFPEVARTTLKNGLGVIVVSHRALPVVHVSVQARGGSASDPKSLPGLADFLSDMLLEGTKTRTKQQIVEEVEFVGGDIGSGCDEDRCRVGVSLLKEHLDLGLELLRDVVSNPAFPTDSIEKIRDRQLADLKRQLAEPGYLAGLAFAEEVFGKGHPYGHIGPSEKSLKAIQAAGLGRLHKRLFAPKNAFVIVAGDVSAQGAVASVEKAFGSWRGKGTAATEPPAPAAIPSRRIVLVDRPGSVQASFLLGSPAVRRAYPEWLDLVVGNQVLGGSASSRLFLTLREERSLTYGAYSRLSGRLGVGYVAASANCRNEVVGEAMKAFLEELGRFRDQPIPEQELGWAKGYLSGLFPTQVETAANVAGMVGQQELYGLPQDYWDTYRSRVLAVSEEGARTLARYLDPEKLVVIVVGDAKAIRSQLTAFGPMKVRKAAH